MRVLMTLWLINLLLAGCVRNEEAMQGSRLYISGDSQSVGADIYIDGKKVGVMKKRIYSGPDLTEEEIKKQHESQRRFGVEPISPLKPGDVYAVGIDIRIINGEREPEYGVYSDIRVTNGKHEISFIDKEGKRLAKQIEIKGENYVAVDFSKMAIQGQ